MADLRSSIKVKKNDTYSSCLTLSNYGFDSTILLFTCTLHITPALQWWSKAPTSY